MKSIRAALSSSTCWRTWRYIGATAARRFRRFYKHRRDGVRRQIAAILPPNVRSAIYTLPMNRQAVKLTKWSAEQFLRSERLNLPHTRTRKNVPDCHRYHLQLFLGGGVLWWTCLSVCVSVCPAHISGTYFWSSPKLACMLPMATARSSSGGVAICRPTSGCVDDVMFAQNGQDEAMQKGFSFSRHVEARIWHRGEYSNWLTMGLWVWCLRLPCLFQKLTRYGSSCPLLSVFRLFSYFPSYQ